MEKSKTGEDVSKAAAVDNDDDIPQQSVPEGNPPNNEEVIDDSLEHNNPAENDDNDGELEPLEALSISQCSPLDDSDILLSPQVPTYFSVSLVN